MRGEPGTESPPIMDHPEHAQKGKDGERTANSMRADYGNSVGDYGDSNDTRIPLMVLASQDWQRTRAMLKWLTVGMVLALWILVLAYMVTRPAVDPQLKAVPVPVGIVAGDVAGCGRSRAVTESVAGHSYIGRIEILAVLPVECPENAKCI